MIREGIHRAIVYGAVCTRSKSGLLMVVTDLAIAETREPIQAYTCLEVWIDKTCHDRGTHVKDTAVQELVKWSGWEPAKDGLSWFANTDFCEMEVDIDVELQQFTGRDGNTYNRATVRRIFPAGGSGRALPDALAGSELKEADSAFKKYAKTMELTPSNVRKPSRKSDDAQAAGKTETRTFPPINTVTNRETAWEWLCQATPSWTEQAQEEIFLAVSSVMSDDMDAAAWQKACATLRSSIVSSEKRKAQNSTTEIPPAASDDDLPF